MFFSVPGSVQMKAKWVLFVAGGVCSIEDFAVQKALIWCLGVYRTTCHMLECFKMRQIL
jgi:hypothetical protein